MAKLNPGEVKAAMATVRKWSKKGANITRTFEFKDFVGSMDFVKKVARAAEKVQHHPDIDIRWNKVTLALSTHSEGGLTQKDFDFAKKTDGLATA